MPAILGLGYAAARASTFTVAASPDGGWTFMQQPYYRAGVTYFGYVDSAGNVEVRTFTNATGVVSSPFVLHATLEVDWHDTPRLHRRISDGKIVAAYCKHDLGFMYVRISTNADDITAWGAETDIAASLGGTADYTYPMLHQLDSETSDPIYMVYRNVQPAAGATGVWCYSKSTDGGATWGAQVEVYKKASKQSYMNTWSDGLGRIDFLVTDGTFGDSASVYHFYYEGGSYYQSDGTLIVASLPLAPTDLTLVYSGASESARYPGGIVRRTSDGHIAGWFPVNTGSDEDYKSARWNGSAWTVSTVTNAGHTGDAWVEGGCAIDPADIDHMMVSKYVSSQWQMHDYVTATFGATWTGTQLTVSANASVYPAFVVDAPSELRAMWLYGTAVSYTNYTFGISGLR